MVNMYSCQCCWFLHNRKLVYYNQLYFVCRVFPEHKAAQRAYYKFLYLKFSTADRVERWDHIGRRKGRRGKEEKRNRKKLERNEKKKESERRENRWMLEGEEERDREKQGEQKTGSWERQTKERKREGDKEVREERIEVSIMIINHGNILIRMINLQKI